MQCQVLCKPCHLKKDIGRGGENRRGEKNGRAKLSAVQVTEIRSSSLSRRQLAEVYGVHEKTIQKIRAGTRW